MFSHVARTVLLSSACLLTALTAHAGVLPPGANDLLYRGEPVLICYTSLPPYCFVNGKLKIVNVVGGVVNGGGDFEAFDVLASVDALKVVEAWTNPGFDD